MLPEEKARVKIDKQLRNAGWDIVARNEYLPNSIDETAIRIQFKISGLSKIKDILTEINEEGKHDRNDGFKTASKASQFDFLDYDDFCTQVAAAVSQSKINGIINICSGRPEKLSDRVERFIKENDYDIKLEYGAFPDRPYDSKAVWGNSQKIEQILEQSTKSQK